MPKKSLALVPLKDIEKIFEKPRRFRNKDRNFCRVCGRYCGEGVARYNDNFVNGEDFPICLDCADSKPDIPHLIYKKIFHQQLSESQKKYLKSLPAPAIKFIVKSLKSAR